jgi:transcription elongation factor GreA
MSIEQFPITPDGHEKLKAEVDHLKKVERPKISEEIGAAIELGDLKENFEYHSAKDRQGMIEAKIRDLEGKLSRAQVIDPTKLSGDRVVFGATVTLEETESGKELCYQILGETEIDIENGKISIVSPLARALIGKEVGDEVKVPGKGGPRMVEIVEVEFV